MTTGSTGRPRSVGGSHRRRTSAGDPDIAPERGGRARRSAEPVGPDTQAAAASAGEPGIAAAEHPANAANSVGSANSADPVDPAASVDPADPVDSANSADPAAGGWWARRRARAAARRAAPRKKAPWWELPVLIVVAVLVAIVVKSFLVQPFYIPSGSMEKTLHGCDGCSGDRVIVNKPVYTVFRDPHPGDIVVFDKPASWPDDGLGTSAPPTNPVLKGVRWFGQLVGVVPPDGEVLIKRVIAVGGQTVKCCDANGNVQVSDDGPNGTFHSLDDSSYDYIDPGLQAFGQLPFGPVTVPAGRLWVMGDHRNNSADSRYNCGGNPGPDNPVCVDASAQQVEDATVPVGNVVGKAVLIAWPPSRWTTLGTPPTFASVPLPAAAGQLGLASLATIGPLGVGLLAAGTMGGWRRRRAGLGRGFGLGRGLRRGLGMGRGFGVGGVGGVGRGVRMLARAVRRDQLQAERDQRRAQRQEQQAARRAAGRGGGAGRRRGGTGGSSGPGTA